MIYFIRCTVTGRVKIGYAGASSLGNRLRVYATSSPTTLEVLAIVDGGRDEERRWHARALQYRHHGEWFDLPLGLVPKCSHPRVGQLIGEQTNRTRGCADCGAFTMGERCSRCCDRASERRRVQRKRDGGERRRFSRKQLAACAAIGLPIGTYKERRRTRSHDEAIAMGAPRSGHEHLRGNHPAGGRENQRSHADRPGSPAEREF